MQRKLGFAVIAIGAIATLLFVARDIVVTAVLVNGFLVGLATGLCAHLLLESRYAQRWKQPARWLALALSPLGSLLLFAVEPQFAAAYFAGGGISMCLAAAAAGLG